MNLELSEEQLLMQDVDSNSLKKRKRVRLEGYGSDSSESEEEGTKTLNVLNFEKNLEEDVEEELQSIETRYLNGQVDEDAQEVAADEAVQSYFNNPEEEIRDEDRVRVKKAAPKIEAFNLKRESKKGTFDESGGYTRKKPGSGNDSDSDSDSDEEKDPKDSWLEGLNRADIAKARDAEEQRKQALLRKHQNEEAQATARPKSEVLQAVIEALQPAESVTEALQRFQKQRKLAQKSKDRQKLQDIKQQVGRLTECADVLLKLGVRRVYHMEKEELMRVYSRETGKPYDVPKGVKRTHEDSDDGQDTADSGERVWEYKWGKDEGEVYGPFTRAEMAYWKESYFNGDVVVRHVGEADFSPIESRYGYPNRSTTQREANTTMTAPFFVLDPRRPRPYIHSYSPLHLPSDPEIERDFFDSFEYDPIDAEAIDAKWVHSHKYPRSLFLDRVNHVLDAGSSHSFDDVGLQCCPRTLRPLYEEADPGRSDTDKTAYVDVQGLMWQCPRQRQHALRNRSNNFESYANLRSSIDAARDSIDFQLEPEYATMKPVGRNGRHTAYFKFKRFASACTPTLSHFQLRNLVAVYDKNYVFYSNFSSPSYGISRFEALTGKNRPLMDVVSADPDNFKISTMSTNRSLLAAGSFTGNILTYYHETSAHREYTLTTDPNGIINYIHVPRDESAHSDEIVVASNDRRLWYFNHERGQILRTETLDLAVNCMSENPVNSNEILVVGDTTETIIVDRRQPLKPPSMEMAGHRDFSFACDWSSENVFATGNQDGTIRIYDRRMLSSQWAAKPLTVLSGGLQGAVRNIRFDPSGKFLAFAESIDNVYIVDTTDIKSWAVQQPMSPTCTDKRRARLSGEGFGTSMYRSGGFRDATVQYQCISMFGSITGLVLTPSDDAHGQVLTIGVSDESVGGILQYELESTQKVLDIGEFW